MVGHLARSGVAYHGACDAPQPTERHSQEAPCTNVERPGRAIALERREAGWCIERGGRWFIEGADGTSLLGPFPTLGAASRAADQLLARCGD
jgi:hypothetical protein